MSTLKILASAAVVLGGGYIGLLLASTLDIRVRQLEQFRLAIEQMGFSISFLKLPVAEAFCGAAKSRSGAVGRILSGAASEISENRLSPAVALERSVQRNRSSLCVGEEELDILSEFAASLGRGDAESELSNINAACARLKIAQAAAEGERDQKGRMWRGIGLLCGMFAVVMLF